MIIFDGNLITWLSVGNVFDGISGAYFKSATLRVSGMMHLISSMFDSRKQIRSRCSDKMVIFVGFF